MENHQSEWKKMTTEFVIPLWAKEEKKTATPNEVTLFCIDFQPQWKCPKVSHIGYSLIETLMLYISGWKFNPKSTYSIQAYFQQMPWQRAKKKSASKRMHMCDKKNVFLSFSHTHTHTLFVCLWPTVLCLHKIFMRNFEFQFVFSLYFPTIALLCNAILNSFAYCDRNIQYIFFSFFDEFSFVFFPVCSNGFTHTYVQ